MFLKLIPKKCLYRQDKLHHISFYYSGFLLKSDFNAMQSIWKQTLMCLKVKDCGLLNNSPVKVEWFRLKLMFLPSLHFTSAIKIFAIENEPTKQCSPPVFTLELSFCVSYCCTTHIFYLIWAQFWMRTITWKRKREL